MKSNIVHLNAHAKEGDGMNIIARGYTEHYKYLLTFGYGSKDYEFARAHKDIACYRGKPSDSDDYIRRHGDKVSPEEALAIFPLNGLTTDMFRR